MKPGSGMCATAFAALMIIGCCVSSIRCREKRRVAQQKQLDDAVQNWEGEGGAVMGRNEEELELASAR